MLSVLVHPEVLDEVPGPSNIDTAVSRKKRRLVASCRNCGFLANHKVYFRFLKKYKHDSYNNKEN